MIFVTVGLHNQGFERLIKKMDEIAEKIDEEVIIQIGHSKYIPKYAKSFKFEDDFSKLNILNKSARVVVCHGGVGSIIAALEQKTPVIAVPRLKKYGEVIDDHQLEIVRRLSEEGKIGVVYDINKLEDILFTDKAYLMQNNKNQLVDSLRKHLNEMNQQKNFDGNKNKKIVKSFNIHGLVKFRIIYSDNLIKLHFNRVFNEYNYFLSETLENYDFVVVFENFVPTTENSIILEDGKYIIKQNYIYIEDSYKSAKWRLEIQNFEDNQPTIVRISSNILGSLFVTSWIVDFIIRWKLDTKGYPMVHGSCVAKNGNAFLFPARSGAGKTTVALHLVEKGYSFLGDDFLILCNNEILCFPSMLNIFMYNLTPLIYANLSFYKKISLHIKNLIYKLSFGYAKFLTPVDLTKIIPDRISEKARLKSICILLSSDRFEVKALTKEECIKYLLFNNKLDSFPFHKYIMEYAYVFPESNLAKYWHMHERNLKNSIDDNIPMYLVKVPRKYDSSTFEKLSKIIEESIEVQVLEA